MKPSRLEDPTCAWCGEPLPPWMRSDAETCSKSCRQARNRFRVAPAGSAASKPMRFAYADPPYPGLARKYYGCAEVDHKKLVRNLVRKSPDGWALSTSAQALPFVLSIVHAHVNARDVRVGAWMRGSRPGVTMRSRNAWEPLIVVGGRPRRLGVDEVLDDVLVCGVSQRPRSHPGALVGMKPPAFCEWMFRMLGAQRGDELVDLFPGSGAVSRAWRLFQQPTTKSGKPSRLAGATLQARSL